jgi:hypothetical protein
MNHTTTLPLLALLLAACGSTDLNSVTHDAESLSGLEARVVAITGGDDASMGTEEGAAVEEGDGGVRVHTVHSPDLNVPMLHTQLPARWDPKATAGGDWYVNSPGLKVQQMKGANFMFVQGPSAQFYQAQGVQLRAPVDAAQIVQQDLMPKMREMGYEPVGMQEAPGIAQADQRGLDGLYSIGQTRKVCQANVSAWRKGDTRSAVVLHWFAIMGPEMANWGYRITRLETTSDRFEREVGTLVDVLAGQRYDPAYFAAYAQSEQMKEGRSWAAHNARMRSNQAAFDAQQRAHRERVDGVNDAIMGTWRNTSSTMDRMQEATIDGIRGEQNALNPHTGQVGKVEAGYNNYWVNSDGQYFGTNDGTYDPNVGGQWEGQWQQMSTEP